MYEYQVFTFRSDKYLFSCFSEISADVWRRMGFYIRVAVLAPRSAS